MAGDSKMGGRIVKIGGGTAFGADSQGDVR